MFAVLEGYRKGQSVVQEGRSTATAAEQELQAQCIKLKGQLALALSVLATLGFRSADFTS